LRQATLDFDLQLARGLDYYTGVIYEVKAHEVEMGSICGGGRYADLTGIFGKPGLSGVGISFGAERIYDVMEALNLFQEARASATQVLLINFGAETYGANLDTLGRLRDSGIAAELYPEAAKLKKQFSYADRLGIPYTVMIGPEEVATSTYQLKNMHSGDQRALTMAELMAALAG
jgi:histidyl-tRNA synthetase